MSFVERENSEEKSSGEQVCMSKRANVVLAHITPGLNAFREGCRGRIPSLEQRKIFPEYDRIIFMKLT